MLDVDKLVVGGLSVKTRTSALRAVFKALDVNN